MRMYMDCALQHIKYGFVEAETLHVNNATICICSQSQVNVYPHIMLTCYMLYPYEVDVYYALRLN